MKWRGQTYRYWSCSHCGTSFVWPRPDAEELASIYAPGVYHAVHYDNFDPSRFRERIAKIKRLLPDSDTILDFGCGNGDFISACEEAGFSPHGVEFTPEGAEEAQERTQLPVESLDEFEVSHHRVDVIHLGDVLEHLAYPRERMRGLESRLKPGGAFVVTGPLELGPGLVPLLSQTYRALKHQLGRVDIKETPPTHLTLTNRDAQKRFMEETLSHQIVHYETQETGWPYLNASEETGMTSRLKWVLGKTAILAHRIDPRTAGIGNRFLCISRPTTHQSPR